MSTLMRAPKHVGSWYWDLEEITPTGPAPELIAATLAAAAKITEVLKTADLLSVNKIEYSWRVPQHQWPSLRSVLFIPVTPLDDPKLLETILGTRPSAFPSAVINNLYISGMGTWFNTDGEPRREPELVNLSLSPNPLGISADVDVHHDIWGWFDFSGRPHPEVYHRNAPRLEAALRDITALFGVEPEIGEPTYFGHALGFGISTDDADDNGMGLDVTDHL